MSDPPVMLEQCARGEAHRIGTEGVTILPLGSLEQHGPHLPLGTDAAIVEKVALGAASQSSLEVPVAVAPTLPFGCSDHHLHYGGTVSVPTRVYYELLCGMLSSLSSSGFSRVFVINGHGGNKEIMEAAVRDSARTHGMYIAAASYWEMAADRLSSENAGGRGEIPGHAGEFETSIMMALGADTGVTPPSQVTSSSGHDKQSATFRLETPAPFREPDGFSDDPSQAGAERGRAYLAAAMEAVAAGLAEFYAETIKTRHGSASW